MFLSIKNRIFRDLLQKLSNLILDGGTGGSYPPKMLNQKKTRTQLQNNKFGKLNKLRKTSNNTGVSTKSNINVTTPSEKNHVIQTADAAGDGGGGAWTRIASKKLKVMETQSSSTFTGSGIKVASPSITTSVVNQFDLAEQELDSRNQPSAQNKESQLESKKQNCIPFYVPPTAYDYPVLPPVVMPTEAPIIPQCKSNSSNAAPKLSRWQHKLQRKYLSAGGREKYHNRLKNSNLDYQNSNSLSAKSSAPLPLWPRERIARGSPIPTNPNLDPALRETLDRLSQPRYPSKKETETETGSVSDTKLSEPLDYRGSNSDSACALSNIKAITTRFVNAEEQLRAVERLSTRKPRSSGSANSIESPLDSGLPGVPPFDLSFPTTTSASSLSSALPLGIPSAVEQPKYQTRRKKVVSPGLVYQVKGRNHGRSVNSQYSASTTTSSRPGVLNKVKPKKPRPQPDEFDFLFARLHADSSVLVNFCNLQPPATREILEELLWIAVTMANSGDLDKHSSAASETVDPITQKVLMALPSISQLALWLWRKRAGASSWILSRVREHLPSLFSAIFPSTGAPLPEISSTQIINSEENLYGNIPSEGINKTEEGSSSTSKNSDIIVQSVSSQIPLLAHRGSGLESPSLGPLQRAQQCAPVILLPPSTQQGSEPINNTMATHFQTQAALHLLESVVHDRESSIISEFPGSNDTKLNLGHSDGSSCI